MEWGLVGFNSLAVPVVTVVEDIKAPSSGFMGDIFSYDICALIPVTHEKRIITMKQVFFSIILFESSSYIRYFLA